MRAKPTVSADAAGYEESSLLTGTGFTCLLLGVDVGDQALLDQLRGAFGLADTDRDNVVDFEYHGRLWFDWAACILEARNLGNWTGLPAPGEDPPEAAVQRMVACIEVAHTFQAACQAFVQLFQAEMRTQIGGYAKNQEAGRSSQDLNRLRTLALALVSLTNFDLVTPTAEDRRYFALFEGHAATRQSQRYIQESCEILYNVQEAEYQWQQSRRDRLLGYLLAGLTSLTLISVAADAYNFVSGQGGQLIAQRLQRIEVLLALALLAVTLIVFVIRPRSRASRAGHRRH